MDWISQGGDVAQVSVGSCVQRRQVWLPSATRAVSLSQQSAPTLLVSYKLCTAPVCHCNNNACMHVKNPKNWEHWQNVAAEGAWELKAATNAIHLLKKNKKIGVPLPLTDESKKKNLLIIINFTHVEKHFARLTNAAPDQVKISDSTSVHSTLQCTTLIFQEGKILAVSAAG